MNKIQLTLISLFILGEITEGQFRTLYKATETEEQNNIKREELISC